MLGPGIKALLWVTVVIPLGVHISRKEDTTSSMSPSSHVFKTQCLKDGSPLVSGALETYL